MRKDKGVIAAAMLWAVALVARLGRGVSMFVGFGEGSGEISI